METRLYIYVLFGISLCFFRSCNSHTFHVNFSMQRVISLRRSHPDCVGGSFARDALAGPTDLSQCAATLQQTILLVTQIPVTFIRLRLV